MGVQYLAGVTGERAVALGANESIRTVANVVTVARTLGGVVLALVALEQRSLVLLGVAYLVYWVGDILDGVAARALDQETRIGAVLDIICDRACTTTAAVAFVALDGDVLVPITIFLLQFCVVDLMLSLSFLYWDVLGPNDYARIDTLLHRLNWTPPAKAVNTSVVVVLCLVGLPWLAAVVALGVLGLKLWCLGRLRHVMGESLAHR